MTALRDIRRRARGVIGPALGAVLASYFGYHMVQGQHGAIAYLQLKAEVAEVRQVLAETRRQRLALERQVALLRPDNLDPDMLEERARLMLNYVRPDEVVVLTGE